MSDKAASTSESSAMIRFSFFVVAKTQEKVRGKGSALLVEYIAAPGR